MRVGDVIGRLGGEEFAAVVPGDGDVASGIAERIRVAFQTAAVELSGHAVNGTVSVGAAWTVDDVHVDKVLAVADAALYRAKAAGRNQLVLADEPAGNPLSDRGAIAAAEREIKPRRPKSWVVAGLGTISRFTVEGRRLLRAAASLGVIEGPELRPAEISAKHPATLP
jgi:hypothetical protein